MNNRLLLAIAGVAAVLIIALAVVLILVVGGGSDKTNAGSGNGNGTPSAASTGTAAPAAAGELRLRGSDPLVLDPAVAEDVISATYIVEIFSGLVRLDSNLRVQGDLADMPQVSADGLTYTFRMKQNATFQDGRPVTSADVKYSWERALSPDTGSVGAENFLGDIAGAKDVSRGRATEISGLKIIDDFTLSVTLDAAKPYFLYKLTYPNTFIVDQRQIKANPKRWTQQPNGTGPYRLAKWALGQQLVLQAYDNNVLGAPKLKTVTFDLSGGSSLVDYENGNIDATGVGLDDLDAVRDPNNKLNKELVQAPNQAIFYIGFNTNEPPFDDPKVRQAFAMAVDRKKIAEVVLKGANPVANGLLMPGVPGYTPDDKTYQYDPARAKQLLSESKYANNMPAITLAESGAGATAGPMTEAIVQNWKDNLGVDVKIQQAEDATFYSDLDAGRYKMFEVGWSMDYPDPEDILDILFNSTSKQNNSRYSNPDVDAKLAQARTETDTEKRLALYQQVEKQLVTDAAWIPLIFGADFALVKPYVKGLEFPPLVIERFRNVEVTR